MKNSSSNNAITFAQFAAPKGQTMKNILTWLVMSTIFSLLVACEHSETEAVMEAPSSSSIEVPVVPLRELWSGSQCGAVEAGTEIIRDKSALQAWWASINKNTLPLPTLAGSFDHLVFPQESVVVIYIGEKPTSGFSVALNAPKGALIDGVLQVPLRINEPPMDTLQAQMLVTPCVIIAAPSKFTSVAALF